ncbi:hypothetical protein HK102_009781, partial [Quaeritorhiza haematococci]
MPACLRLLPPPILHPDKSNPALQPNFTLPGYHKIAILAEAPPVNNNNEHPHSPNTKDHKKRTALALTELRNNWGAGSGEWSELLKALICYGFPLSIEVNDPNHPSWFVRDPTIEIPPLITEISDYASASPRRLTEIVYVVQSICLQRISNAWQRLYWDSVSEVSQWRHRYELLNHTVSAGLSKSTTQKIVGEITSSALVQQERSLRKQYEGEIQKLRNHVKSLSARLKDADEVNKNVTDQTNDARVKVFATMKQLETEKSKRKQLEITLDQEKQWRKSATDKVVSLKSQLASAEHAMGQQSGEITRLQNLVNTLSKRAAPVVPTQPPPNTIASSLLNSYIQQQQALFQQQQQQQHAHFQQQQQQHAQFQHYQQQQQQQQQNEQYDQVQAQQSSNTRQSKQNRRKSMAGAGDLALTRNDNPRAMLARRQQHRMSWHGGDPATISSLNASSSAGANANGATTTAIGTIDENEGQSQPNTSPSSSNSPSPLLPTLQIQESRLSWPMAASPVSPHVSPRSTTLTPLDTELSTPSSTHPKSPTSSALGLHNIESVEVDTTLALPTVSEEVTAGIDSSAGATRNENSVSLGEGSKRSVGSMGSGA